MLAYAGGSAVRPEGGCVHKLKGAALWKAFEREVIDLAPDVVFEGSIAALYSRLMLAGWNTVELNGRFEKKEIISYTVELVVTTDLSDDETTGTVLCSDGLETI